MFIFSVKFCIIIRKSLHFLFLIETHIFFLLLLFCIFHSARDGPHVLGKCSTTEFKPSQPKKKKVHVVMDQVHKCSKYVKCTYNEASEVV
jgi:hypothetical protein